MKELAIYFPNVRRLMQMDEAMREVNIENASMYLITTLFTQNPNIYDYSVNLGTTSWIRMLQDKYGLDFSRLYFGQEFCENLVPSAEEVEQAYFFSRQMDWDFTYVTGGSHTEKGVARVRENLEKLRSLQADCEVVVNDWGILNIVSKEYPEFKMVLGRILNKQTRLNLFMQGVLFPCLKSDIEQDVETIRRNQIAAYADVSVSNPDYLELLKSMGIQGVDFDMTPQGVDRPEDGWGLNMGYYYPWTFIATARNCPTAGTVDPQRTYIMTDKNCGRPCQRINCSPNLQQFEVPLVQRGPALFINNEAFNKQYLENPPPYERLIYQPAIPI